MKRYLVFILFFTAVFQLRGQDFDAALDRFASITNECQQLKARIEAGETLQDNTLDRLYAELRLLQKELQGGSRSMSSTQKERYRLILECYQDGKMVPASALYADSLQTGITTTHPSTLSHPEHRSEGHLAGRDQRYFVMATASWPLEGGLMAGFMNPFRKWGGAFFRISGNAWYPSHTRNAASDGSSDSGFIWTNGNARSSLLTVTVDAIWFLSPAPVGLYTGGGYGFSHTFWQTTDGSWAHITDKSIPGPAVDLGVIYARRHLTVSVGATTLAFRTVSGMVGIGYRF